MFATNASLTKYELKMAKYRTSSFLVLRTEMKSRSLKKMQKKNEANIQPLWTTTLVKKGFITWLREL